MLMEPAWKRVNDQARSRRSFRFARNFAQRATCQVVGPPCCPRGLACAMRDFERQQISYVALWLVICLGGGSIAIAVLYLATGSQSLGQWLAALCSGQLQ
jgi:hypothetical protein